VKSEEGLSIKKFPSIACDGEDADAGLGIQLGWLMTFRKCFSKKFISY
jgi:hypothetical protein